MSHRETQIPLLPGGDLLSVTTGSWGCWKTPCLAGTASWLRYGPCSLKPRRRSRAGIYGASLPASITPWWVLPAPGTFEAFCVFQGVRSSPIPSCAAVILSVQGSLYQGVSLTLLCSLFQLMDAEGKLLVPALQSYDLGTHLRCGSCVWAGPKVPGWCCLLQPRQVEPPEVFPVPGCFRCFFHSFVGVFLGGVFRQP